MTRVLVRCCLWMRAVRCVRCTAPRLTRVLSRTLAIMLAGALVPAAAVQARERAGVAATAQATIVAPLSVVKVQDISFGRIVARPAAGTVTVDSGTGQCMVTGAILDVGKCQFAAFAGMGGRNFSVRISLGNTASLSGPGQPMVLDNIVIGTNSSLSLAANGNSNGNAGGKGNGNGNQRYSISSASGIFVVNIGGRLNVNANQAPGVYRGAIDITLQYQ